VDEILETVKRLFLYYHPQQYPDVSKFYSYVLSRYHRFGVENDENEGRLDRSWSYSLWRCQDTYLYDQYRTLVTKLSGI
jgi:hypothetical protein